MNVLAVDLGLKKTGIAIARGPLAEPIRVIHHNSFDTLISQLTPIVKDEKIDMIILGVSENKMGETQKGFAQKLKNKFNLPIEFVDETLSSKDVQRMSIEAGHSPKKRRQMEDAFAAALILQNYLDNL